MKHFFHDTHVSSTVKELRGGSDVFHCPRDNSNSLIDETIARRVGVDN